MQGVSASMVAAKGTLEILSLWKYVRIAFRTKISPAYSHRKVPTLATAEAFVLRDAFVMLAIPALTSAAYSELAWSVRPVKGLEPGARVTADAHAARGFRRVGSRLSKVSVGTARARAAKAAKPKIYFMITEVER